MDEDREAVGHEDSEETIESHYDKKWYERQRMEQ